MEDSRVKVAMNTGAPKTKTSGGEIVEDYTESVEIRHILQPGTCASLSEDSCNVLSLNGSHMGAEIDLNSCVSRGYTNYQNPDIPLGVQFSYALHCSTWRLG